jgi:hypothetical protein
VEWGLGAWARAAEVEFPMADQVAWEAAWAEVAFPTAVVVRPQVATANRRPSRASLGFDKGT